MKRIHQIAALLFMMFSAFIIWESVNLQYYSELGPGAGFFPFWLGSLLGVLSLVWLIQVSRSSGWSNEGASFPGLAGTGRIVAIIASLLLLSVLMNPLGYQITMFLILLFLVRVLGGQRLWVTLTIALLGSVGVYHVFGIYLDVALPESSLLMLRNLGL